MTVRRLLPNRSCRGGRHERRGGRFDALARRGSGAGRPRVAACSHRPWVTKASLRGTVPRMRFSSMLLRGIAASAGLTALACGGSTETDTGNVAAGGGGGAGGASAGAGGSSAGAAGATAGAAGATAGAAGATAGAGGSVSSDKAVLCYTKAPGEMCLAKADPMTSSKLGPAASMNNACAAQALEEATVEGDQCCYLSQLLLCGGRPLVADGAPRVAVLAQRTDWAV